MSDETPETPKGTQHASEALQKKLEGLLVKPSKEDIAAKIAAWKDKNSPRTVGKGLEALENVLSRKETFLEMADFAGGLLNKINNIDRTVILENNTLRTLQNLVINYSMKERIQNIRKGIEVADFVFQDDSRLTREQKVQLSSMHDSVRVVLNYLIQQILPIEKESLDAANITEDEAARAKGYVSRSKHLEIAPETAKKIIAYSETHSDRHEHFNTHDADISKESAVERYAAKRKRVAEEWQAAAGKHLKKIDLTGYAARIEARREETATELSLPG